MMTKPRVVSRDNVLPVHAASALTGEVPFWDEQRGTLWWADIQGQRLLAFTPRTARQEVHHMPAMPGLIASRRDGRLLIGLEDGLYAFDPAGGQLERLIGVEENEPRTRINDGKADPAGRLWFGTMERMGSGEQIGSLYRLDPDRSLHVVRRPIGVPNSINFSPDGRRLYFADSRATRAIETFSYDPQTAEIGPPQVFARYAPGETPDGSCVDADGALWTAVIGGGRLERRLPDGTLDTIIELPVSRPTMPTLGGSDRRTLFVTSQRRFLAPQQLAHEPLAGHLLAVRVAVPGIPDWPAAL